MKQTLLLLQSSLWQGNRWNIIGVLLLFTVEAILIALLLFERQRRKRVLHNLRESEEFNRAVLSSFSSHVAVLDKEGMIIAINEAWSQFARENGAPPPARIGVGVNYLEVCRRAAAQPFAPVLKTLENIKCVLDGRAESYAEEYSCPSPTEPRWFLMWVTPLRRSEGGAVISHTNITELKLAEEALREGHAHIKDLAGRLIAAQEGERRRIGRELHDDVNQRVAAISIALSNLKRRLPDAQNPVRDQIIEIQKRISDLSDRVRHLSHELHSATLQHVGLAATLKSYCAEFSNLEGIEIRLEIQGRLARVPDEEALCLYRIVQEALRNIAKHAHAQRVNISLAVASGFWELCVDDDGAGFDMEQARRREGLGLISMEERVKLLQGGLEVQTRPGSGTKLRARLPVRESDEQSTGSAG